MVSVRYIRKNTEHIGNIISGQVLHPAIQLRIAYLSETLYKIPSEDKGPYPGIHFLCQVSNMESEPIAIIGLSCKFAGDAKTPAKLWALLEEGRSAWSEIPSSRFNPKGAYHPSREKLSTVSSV